MRAWLCGLLALPALEVDKTLCMSVAESDVSVICRSCSDTPRLIADNYKYKNHVQLVSPSVGILETAN